MHTRRPLPIFLFALVLYSSPAHLTNDDPFKRDFGYKYYDFETSVPGANLCQGNSVGVPFRFSEWKSDPALEIGGGSAYTDMQLYDDTYYCMCLDETSRICPRLEFYSYGGGLTNCNMRVTAQLNTGETFNVLIEYFQFALAWYAMLDYDIAMVSWQGVTCPGTLPGDVTI